MVDYIGTDTETLIGMAIDKGMERIALRLDKTLVESVIPRGRTLLLVSEEYSMDSYTELEECSGLEIEYRETPPFLEVNIEVPDGTALIVAIGGSNVMRGAKALAYRYRTSLILCPIGEYSEAFGSGRGMRRADVIVLHARYHETLVRDGLSAAMGEVVSKLIAMEDYRFRSLMEGRRPNESVIESVHNTVGSLVDEGVFSENKTHRLTDAVARVYSLMHIVGATDGAEAQLGGIISEYALVREGDRRLRGEDLFLGAMIVGKLYESFMESGIGAFGIPPDRGLSAERIRRVLRVPERVSLSVSREYDPDMEIVEHKLRTYVTGLLDGIKRTNMLLYRAMDSIRLTMSDGGYYLKYYVSGRELMRLLILAPDYLPRATLLSFIKDRGLLEDLAV